jgi:hypothetical protein
VERPSFSSLLPNNKLQSQLVEFFSSGSVVPDADSPFCPLRSRFSFGSLASQSWTLEAVQSVRSKPVDISEKLSVMHKFPQLHRREVDVWMQNEKNGLEELQLRETKAKMRKSRRQKTHSGKSQSNLSHHGPIDWGIGGG